MASSVLDSTYLLAQDGFRAQDSIDQKEKEVGNITQAIRADEERLEERVNELKSIAEHHTATVQGIEALVNRSTVCVETVMGISAAVEEMKAEQATQMERVAKIAEHAAEVEERVMSLAPRAVALENYAKAIEEEVNYAAEGIQAAAMQSRPAITESREDWRVVLTRASEYDTISKQGAGLARGTEMMKGETAQFKLIELPLMLRDQETHSSKILEARARGHAAKATLSVTEEQSRRVMQLVTSDSSNIVARHARAKEQLSLSTGKSAAIASAREKQKTTASEHTDKTKTEREKARLEKDSTTAVVRESEEDEHAAVARAQSIAALQARVKEAANTLQSNAGDYGITALQQENAALAKDIEVATAAEDEATRKLSELLSAMSVAEAAESTNVAAARREMGDDAASQPDAGGVAERALAAAVRMDSEAHAASEEAARGAEEIRRRSEELKVAAERAAALKTEANQLKAAVEAGDKAKAAKFKALDGKKPKRTELREKLLETLRTQLKAQEAEQAAEGEKEVEGADAAGQEEVSHAKEGLDKLLADANEKIETKKASMASP